MKNPKKVKIKVNNLNTIPLKSVRIQHNVYNRKANNKK